jgi:hypothetical protein
MPFFLFVLTTVVSLFCGNTHFPPSPYGHGRHFEERSIFTFKILKRWIFVKFKNQKGKDRDLDEDLTFTVHGDTG